MPQDLPTYSKSEVYMPPSLSISLSLLLNLDMTFSFSDTCRMSCNGISSAWALDD